MNMKRFRRTLQRCGILAAFALCALSIITPLSTTAHAQSFSHQQAAKVAIPHNPDGIPAPCYATSCANQDPYNLGCATSHSGTDYINNVDRSNPQPIINPDGTQVGFLINAYSSWCNANWAEVIMDNSDPVHLYIYTADQTEYTNYPNQQDPNASDYYYNGQQGYPAWNDMVDGTQWTEATACTVEQRAAGQNCTFADK